MAAADTAGLLGWLKVELARGCTAGSLMRAMLDSGWSLDDATQALVGAALHSQSGGALHVAGDRTQALTAVATRGPDLKPGADNTVRVGDRDLRIVLDMREPRVVVVADLLTPQECEALIALASGRLKRSQTVSSQEASTAEVNAARTSEGMFFDAGENDLVAALEQRIAELVQWPLDHAEGLQVLRYGAGAEYRPHFDHFDDASAGGAAALSRGGQRVGTMVVYLRAPEAGGATVFPDVGLQVRPLAGYGVFFAYPQAHGKQGVLHGGAPVSAGEKWIATKWLREKKFV